MVEKKKTVYTFIVEMISSGETGCAIYLSISFANGRTIQKWGNTETSLNIVVILRILLRFRVIVESGNYWLNMLNRNSFKIKEILFEYVTPVCRGFCIFKNAIIPLNV